MKRTKKQIVKETAAVLMETMRSNASLGARDSEPIWYVNEKLRQALENEDESLNLDWKGLQLYSSQKGAAAAGRRIISLLRALVKAIRSAKMSELSEIEGILQDEGLI